MSALQRVKEFFTQPGPSMDVVSELAATKYTPDVWVLEQKTHWHVFVFDHLKKDHPLNNLLGNSKLKWPAYTMKQFQLWEAPAPWENYIPTEAKVDIPRFPPSAKIRGEIWKVPTEQILRLDTHYQNTVEFHRQRVRLLVPTRKVVLVKDPSLDPDFGVMEVFNRSEYTGSSTKHTQERVAIVYAWMYIGNPKFWDPVISSYAGYISAEHFEAKQRRWLPKYYHIRRPDTNLR